jgi:hypothetical protein
MPSKCPATPSFSSTTLMAQSRGNYIAQMTRLLKSSGKPYMLPSSTPSSEIIISDKKGLIKALSHDIIQSIQEEKKEVKQMLIKMSKHATQDRIDRLLFIYDNVGIGEPYIDSVEDDVLYTITTTGILLIRSAKDGTLITAYIADIDKITAIWRNKHGERPMPDNLYKRVLANAFFDRMWNKQEKEKKKNVQQEERQAIQSL